jgi:alkanesulfonate monooxygenase SsuD/methylene tetrahydromethanopterin reductase-like flavin-dependent oxidoreductase (luciferase family)
MTPEFAAGARESVHSGAADAGREPPPVFGYVRTAVGGDAKERLAKEESFYRDLHDGYRRQFARLDRPPGTVGIAEDDPSAARTAVDEYDALDVVVVRGLASATLEAMGAVASAAAPR